jgi:heparan-alpha-glucosaminide N-acetyltransferase
MVSWRVPPADGTLTMTAILTQPRSFDKPAAAPAAPAPPKPAEKPPRLVSLDAYRGFIMLVMASAGFGFVKVWRQSFPEDPVWRFLAYEFDHVPWVGCSFWDLIQPSFMFMVGVAMPYSYASRVAKGESDTRIYAHAVWRAFLLIALAVFLSSPLVVKTSFQAWGAATGATGRLIPVPAPATNFVFTNVLAQIGLGYVFVFMLRGRGWKVQLAALAIILAGYTALFGLYPLRGPGFDFASVGAAEPQTRFTGWFAHWDKNTNAAADFDVWFLNLFPRPAAAPFVYNDGGYATLNFVPSMATMILGLMAGELLRGPRSNAQKFLRLAAAGLACLAAGWLAGLVVCPIVKRIWTPSWALFSAGWTFGMLAAFFGVIDVAGWKRWAWPLTVVGMNSIAMYCMSQLLKGWVAGRLKMHLVPGWFEGTYGPIIEATAVLFVLWLVCVWLWRRGIFLRI